MLGTRTKQVNSYGRRGSRIVNVSHRRDHGSANSSEAASDADTPLPHQPLRRENAFVISPTKSLRRFKGASRSPRYSSLAQDRINQPRMTRNSSIKRAQSKLQSSACTRQPLTPIRANGTTSNDQRSSGAKSKSNIKPSRASLKPHAPVIPVDIIILDEHGNTLTQERRLSHPEIQGNQGHTTAGKGKKKLRASTPSPPPIAISDDSDLEIHQLKSRAKRLKSKSRAIVISSDESEVDDSHSVCKVSARSVLRSKSLRMEVVIPRIPFQRTPIPPPLALNLQTSSLPGPTLQPGPAAAPSLLVPPIPASKPRQLTPIRGSSRSIFRRVPPTPSTPTEADLSLDLAQLDLSDGIRVDGLTSSQPVYLVPLLDECGQTSPYEFSAFIETFPFDPIVQCSIEDKVTKFRKIGEASYSEVFGIGDVVLKIIPIRSEEDSMYPERAEMPASSDAKDVLKEIVVTRRIGDICDKFVRLLKTYIVKGRYPSLLLDLWDEYNDGKGSESIRPDSFSLKQVYAIIILPNGGPDLESFVFKNVLKFGWRQACGIFWQVARALEQAEHLSDFEHRDLHWGQILVKRIPIKRSTRKSLTPCVAMDDTRLGIKVTIIDLGLCRMNATDAGGSTVYWTPFDDEIFEGEGDYQYDIYRMMRAHIGGSWKSYCPFTNVMWLHYLVKKLLHEKRLKPPSGQKHSGGETRTAPPTGFNEQQCYDCLVEMEKVLGRCTSAARQGQKTCRKTVAPSSGLKSVEDVIAYGVRRGWVL